MRVSLGMIVIQQLGQVIFEDVEIGRTSQHNSRTDQQKISEDVFWQIRKEAFTFGEERLGHHSGSDLF